MASITIRNLDDGIKSKLRLQAALFNRSMEEEARHILRAALTSPVVEGRDLAQAIRSRLVDIDGADLEIMPREGIRNPPDLT
jgi:antitoxin FitA